MPARPVSLSVAVFVGLLLLATVVDGQKAQARPFEEPTSRVVGAKKATCTLRTSTCSYQVTCHDPSGVNDPSGEGACLFRLALLGTSYLTRVSQCIREEDGSGECLPEAEGEILYAGKTKTLKLRLLNIGRRQIKSKLQQGKRVIKGNWEAVRPDLSGPFGPHDEAEADTWDAVPGFFTYGPTNLGYVVFQTSDRKSIRIRLKR